MGKNNSDLPKKIIAWMAAIMAVVKTGDAVTNGGFKKWRQEKCDQLVGNDKKNAPSQSIPAAASPTPANSPNAPRPANSPGKIKLADDWIHSGYRVVLLAPKKTGKTTLAMTIAYDLAQGRAPRVFDLEEEIPRQYVIYYQFDLDGDDLRDCYPSATQYREWMEVYCIAGGLEAKSLFEDAKRRILKREYPMVTVFVDNLDKIRSGKSQGTATTDDAFFDSLDIFRAEMKNMGYQVTVIVLNHATYRKGTQAPVWRPVTEVYMRGSTSTSNRLDVLHSVGPTREDKSVMVIRECFTRHREALEDEKVAIVRRVKSPDLQFVFDRWDNINNVLPLKSTYGKASKPENRTLQQKKEEGEPKKRGGNIDWTDDMLLRAAEVIETLTSEAEKAGNSQPSYQAVADAIRVEFCFEKYEKTQAKRLIERLREERLIGPKTLIVELKNCSA